MLNCNILLIVICELIRWIRILRNFKYRENLYLFFSIFRGVFINVCGGMLKIGDEKRVGRNFFEVF